MIFLGPFRKINQSPICNHILKSDLVLGTFLVCHNNFPVYYGCQKISAFGNFLSELRTDSAYHHFFESTASLVGKPSSVADKRYNYKSLYFQVVGSIMSMLSERFADWKNFAFLNLVNPFIFKQSFKQDPYCPRSLLVPSTAEAPHSPIAEKRQKKS